jgi:hypothetical protein
MSCIHHLQTLREEIGKVYRSNPDDRGDPYSPHNWWIFDSRETSGKTCPVCLSLHLTHYRGDEIHAAFPYHIQVSANKMKAMVHPHCRCRLIWTGYTKDIMDNPYGILKRPAKKAELPAKVAGRQIDLSPSQAKLYKKTSKHARETFRGIKH